MRVEGARWIDASSFPSSQPRRIGSAYAHADYVGSLVLPEGDRARPTAWQTVAGEWFPW
jgi:hypothetical protein